MNGVETLHPEQRRRLASMVGDLRTWVENTPVPVSSAEVQSNQAIAAAPPLKKVRNAAEPAAPATVLKSIVEQIDDVLQDTLQDSPYKDRDIHLAEGPGGIVLVKDGLKKFEGIEEVPEPEIKALIRQAVADWENKPH